MNSKIILYFKVIGNFGFIVLFFFDMVDESRSLSSSSEFGKKVLPRGPLVSFSNCSQQIMIRNFKSRVKTVL